MRIEPFDPVNADEATALAYCALLHETATASFPDGLLPPPEHLLNTVRNVSDDHRTFTWLGYDGDAAVALAELSWWEAPDNRDRGWLYPAALPAYAEDAIAAFLPALAETMRAHGRSLFNVDVPQGHPLASWMAVRGGRRGSVEQHNVWRSADADVDDLKALTTVPDGYEVFSFDDACPDDLLEPYTRLVDTMNTAPRDDLTMEDWSYTPDRIRRWEEGLARRGHTIWTVVAREVETGELAAFNQLVVRPEWPEVVENEDTAVAVPHRGRGLGLCIKATNLLRVLTERPETRAVETWNAASNAHMLRVNRRLGFVCEHVWESWEIGLSEAEPA